jgi:phosphohistidine phosphatase
MRTLTLLRHARSSHDAPTEADFDRPLNRRGMRAAERIGRFIADEGLTFDRVLASPAVRVRETIAGVEAGLGRPLGAEYDRRLYLAGADSLFDIIAETADDIGHLLLVGHNPGLEMLLLEASAGHANALRHEAELKYPTATLASIAFADAKIWPDAGPGTGEVIRFVRPRDLDPTLGPDF